MSMFVPKTPTVVVRRDAVARVPWFRSHLVVMEDSEFFLSLAAAGQSFVFNDQITVRVRRLGDNPLGLPDRTPEDSEEWLNSVLHFHNAKMPLCCSRSERAFVSEEIASYAFQLGQYYTERFDLRAARAAYKYCLNRRVSRRALQAYLATLLPAWVRKLNRTPIVA